MYIYVYIYKGALKQLKYSYDFCDFEQEHLILLYRPSRFSHNTASQTNKFELRGTYKNKHKYIILYITQ